METINEVIRESRLKAGLVSALAQYLSYVNRFDEGDGLEELLENMREDAPFVLMQQKMLEEAARRMTLAEERGLAAEMLEPGKEQLKETAGLVMEALDDVYGGLQSLERRIAGA